MVIGRSGKKGPVSVRHIVSAETLPQDYIEQLLLKLRRGRLIESVRGVNGGYLLSRPAREISVKDVLEAVEGHTFEVICARNKKARKSCCHSDERCVLRDVWRGLKGRIEDYLDAVSVQDLIDKEAGRRRTKWNKEPGSYVPLSWKAGGAVPGSSLSKPQVSRTKEA